MSLIKKLILGWLGLSFVIGGWALITGNTSEEAMLTNQFADICEEVLDETEDDINNQLGLKLVEAGKPGKIKIDGINEELITAERGYNGAAITCPYELDANFDTKGINVFTIVKLEHNGDVVRTENVINGLHPQPKKTTSIASQRNSQLRKLARKQTCETVFETNLEFTKNQFDTHMQKAGAIIQASQQPIIANSQSAKPNAFTCDFILKSSVPGIEPHMIFEVEIDSDQNITAVVGWPDVFDPHENLWWSEL
ncbi:hypothetical protein [Vibrio parahaemolyticus]|uniref:hypothetical protein n=1 Tax=Vibrio parahaemolyticus TaxID=670 RepID=UPI0011218417|nr:hypothetical protein [Vibrio parahaemolyticus]TOB86535.1 hypothetical protein CGJ95_22225 [Vibrio parahaemolyticus]TOH87524.1 hypothetical protein CGI71_20065 [Vibrio parahaemolyticus]TOL02718.1 hypothetical protein CGI09_16630 [Vibrio parahaemolyticus]TOP86920.1 hypothetical protein CGH08_10500 [Vibrio parahaemolyticus]HAV1362947.1 hypothetical protein [Vibrio parahaemolyticus]